MKCPVCLIEHTKSTVTEGGGARTLMGHLPFHDEEGKRHDHDPNISTTGYKCSRGHVFSVALKRSCWCGHGRDYFKVNVSVGIDDPRSEETKERCGYGVAVTDAAILSAMRA